MENFNDMSLQDLEDAFEKSVCCSSPYCGCHEQLELIQKEIESRVVVTGQKV